LALQEIMFSRSRRRRCSSRRLSLALRIRCRFRVSYGIGEGSVSRPELCKEGAVLARLWRRTEDPDTVAKPTPLTVAADCSTQRLPPTIAANHCQKRRRKRVPVCRLYLNPPSQASIHARTLLAFVQEECPEYVGGYVPRPDLEKCYRRDLCAREGWPLDRDSASARRAYREEIGEGRRRALCRVSGAETMIGTQIGTGRPRIGTH
jgi:hypothetical protein